MPRVFLSHSHTDKDVAGALRVLLESCLPGHVEVMASSASPGEGGVPSGGDWFDWIRRQVTDSGVTVVLLTPASLNKPWLMWEAGAVAGVSLAREHPTPIVPLLYRLSAELIPSPLRSRQAVLGEDGDSLRQMLETVRAMTKMPAASMASLARDAIPAYLAAVRQALADRPPSLTESCVQDWLDRITYFERTHRRSEIAQIHSALVNVFARGDNAFDTPLDVRLHRRLGDIYLFSKNAAEADRQYALALQLSPRDIFLLHKRGLALLERGDEPGAEAMLAQLVEVDPRAVRWSTEVAGMKGRLHWQRHLRSNDRRDLLAARDAYAEGLAGNPNSHYMADNVGQLSLLLGEPDAARVAFEAALAALAHTGDSGYWAVATRATALLGLGREAEGLQALAEVPRLQPEPAAMDSIRRGVRRLHTAMALPRERLDTWLAALGS